MHVTLLLNWYYECLYTLYDIQYCYSRGGQWPPWPPPFLLHCYWPHIKSTIRNGWGASVEPHEFNNLSVEPDNKMAVGPHPLESVLGAEKRFSAKRVVL